MNMCLSNYQWMHAHFKTDLSFLPLASSAASPFLMRSCLVLMMLVINERTSSFTSIRYLNCRVMCRTQTYMGKTGSRTYTGRASYKGRMIYGSSLLWQIVCRLVKFATLISIPHSILHREALWRVMTTFLRTNFYSDARVRPRSWHFQFRLWCTGSSPALQAHSCWFTSC